MPAYAVSLDALSETIDRLATFDADVLARLGELDARIARLHRTWAGAAAEEHRAAHARWARGADEMRDALVTLRRIAATAHGNYTATVAANRAMWA